MVAIKKHYPEPDENIETPDVIELSPDEAMAFFDREARFLVGMSGEEFLRHWDAGEFQSIPDETPDDRKLASLVMALPLVGRTLS